MHTRVGKARQGLLDQAQPLEALVGVASSPRLPAPSSSGLSSGPGLATGSLSGPGQGAPFLGFASRSKPLAGESSCCNGRVSGVGTAGLWCPRPWASGCRSPCLSARWRGWGRHTETGTGTVSPLTLVSSSLLA